MACSTLPVLLQRFFAGLRNTEDLSSHTIACYRDTLRLLLHFIASRQQISLDQIPLSAFQPEMTLNLLEHLQKERRNTARTRNVRLAGIRAFVRFCLGEVEPDVMCVMQRILAIPGKRCDKPLLGFLNGSEMKAILEATDRSRWTGRRDHLLFSLLYNSGGRISGILRITPADFRRRVLRLNGKGRKQRELPLWIQTCRLIQRWVAENQIGDSQPIFGNRNGQPISRRAAGKRLNMALCIAKKACSSLRGRKITLHTCRHTCAMHLLQAGVSVELIALWLGHEQMNTTHGYLEADLTMKKQILAHLHPLATCGIANKRKERSQIMGILDAM